MLGIDLGSNTLRYCVLDENLKLLKEGEFIIGAAKGLESSGLIGDEAILKLKNALSKMKEQGLELENARAVATAAFRKAKNTDEIFKNLKNEFGVNFKLISASDEARLSILGMNHVLKSLKFQSLEKAYCDLGGASCELSFKELSKSFDFGIISFYEGAKSFKLRALKSFDFSKMLEKYPQFAFKFKDKKLKLSLLIKDKNLLKLAFAAFDKVALAKKFITSFKKLHFKQVQNEAKNDEIKGTQHKFKNTQGKIKNCKFSQNKFKKAQFKRSEKMPFFVLNSGVPTAVAGLKKNLDLKTYSALKINGTRLKSVDFLKYALIIAKMSEQKAALKIGKNRANHLLAGCFLFYALFDKEKLIIVDEGLREGLCLQALKNSAQK